LGATARRAVESMTRVFFVVGPTATGKSELAADLAHDVDAEIVNSDAFQIYRGLDLLTAKPDQATRAKAPHHLIGTMSIREEMNAEKFRRLALATLDEIHSRKKVAIVVGGSGLYIKGLTHGLSDLPEADPSLRTQLDRLTLDQLRARLVDLDPKTVDKIDIKNRRRLVRALEICLMTGRPASAQRTKWKAVGAAVASGTGKRVQDATRSAPKAFGTSTGVLVFRDRDELYQRINQRVTAMFQNGVIEEVRATGAMSETASKMIGLREIRELLDGKLSILQCVAQIQQASRRYAKRQLTWFRRQTNFEPLNLSLLSHNEAVKWISQRASRSLVQGND
jgi:tRNA dimethylallyltransferase